MQIKFPNWLRRKSANWTTIAGPIDNGDTFLRGWNMLEQPSLLANSAVMACAGYIMDKLPEPPPQIRRDEGTDDPVVENHPFGAVLQNPHPYHTWSSIAGAVGVSLAVDGNAYIRVTSSKAGPLLEWLPTSSVQPVADVQNPAKLARYDYNTGRGTVAIAPEEMMHFRNGIDANNPFLGVSRLKSALQEILTDSEATEYQLSVLRKLGIVGGIIHATGDGVVITPDQAKEIEQRFEAKFLGKGRGGLMVTDGRLGYTDVGMTPDKMALRESRKTPEERICAMFPLSPMVVGLGAGLDRSTFSNMAEARKAAAEDCLAPKWSLMADVMTRRLRELRLIGDKEYIDFNLTKVRALQENETDRIERWGKAFDRGAVMRSEYRTQLGLASTPEDDVYKTDLTGALAQDAMLAKHARDSQERAALYESLGIE